MAWNLASFSAGVRGGTAYGLDAISASFATVFLSLPDRLPAARQAELRPHRVDLGDDLVRHADLGAPNAVRLRPDLGRRVEADLGAESGLGRGEVEVVDRRALD